MNPIEASLLAALLLASALFSGSEAALFSLNQVQIRQLQARKDQASRSVCRLLRTPQRLLNSLLVANTLVNVGLSSAVTSLAIAQFGPSGVQVAILAASAGLLLFGEILPKTIAVIFPRAVARASAIPLAVLLPPILPFSSALAQLTRAAHRVFGLPQPGAAVSRRVSRSELQAVLEEIDEAGMSKLENQLLQNILAFSRRTAEEVMTPRVDIVAAPVDSTPEQLREVITRTKHSKIPLYDKTLDSISGFLPAREFLLDPGRRISQLIRPVLIVPEKAPIDRIFQDLRKGRWRMAIVVNEYGETVGLMSQEDLIEEVVGELFDEYEPAQEEIVPVGAGTWEVLGRTSLQDLADQLEEEIPQEQAVTVNGFLCALHGGFPRPGTVLHFHNLEFEVLDVSRHRIQKVRVQRIEEPEEEEE
ncbi:MAG: hemolysin family protein [Candidatus Eisenbacteria bacterium]|nr:hemolysin family protein [Candidatus Eisenbacteria bacterium]